MLLVFWKKEVLLFTSGWSIKLPLSWDIELTETDIPGVTLEKPLESATFFVMELKESPNYRKVSVYNYVICI